MKRLMVPGTRPGFLISNVDGPKHPIPPSLQQSQRTVLEVLGAWGSSGPDQSAQRQVRPLGAVKNVSIRLLLLTNMLAVTPCVKNQVLRVAQTCRPLTPTAHLLKPRPQLQDKGGGGSLCRCPSWRRGFVKAAIMSPPALPLPG